METKGLNVPTTGKREIKEYDFTSLNDFFNTGKTPAQLDYELTNLLYNYASLVDEDGLEVFKNDVGTLYLIHTELVGLAVKAGELDV